MRGRFAPLIKVNSPFKVSGPFLKAWTSRPDVIGEQLKKSIIHEATRVPDGKPVIERGDAVAPDAS
jgi:hypothetical protein